MSVVVARGCQRLNGHTCFSGWRWGARPGGWACRGGQDDVVITASGCRVLTNVPRTVAEIEATMA
eukprot:728686-Alexandrium_andersonii.AAC.1